jgi:hypothetical protein
MSCDRAGGRLERLGQVEKAKERKTDMEHWKLEGAVFLALENT